ncbi:MAG: hypothetical protein HQM16_03640 [Deltaproteobacteria bacterium]|nr:hypothetical protein [Deltaproteobacteria bacterium]
MTDNNNQYNQDKNKENQKNKTPETLRHTGTGTKTDPRKIVEPDIIKKNQVTQGHRDSMKDSDHQEVKTHHTEHGSERK